MIVTILSLLLIFSTVYNSYKLYKKDSQLLNDVYFTRPLDYLWGFLTFLSLVLVIGFVGPHIPDFLKFSWLNLIGSEGTNLITAPIGSANEGSSIFTLIYISIFYIVFIFCLPYLAKSEEEMFRSMNFGTKTRIKESIKFGFIHMIVGVPIYVAILLCFIGFIFSIRYCLSFKKNLMLGVTEADRIAILDSTSFHAKYNLIILTLVWLVTMIVCLK
jgi:hypothetical protein